MHQTRIGHGAAIARSKRILNSIIRDVIAEATDPDIVCLARRFPLTDRYSIYRHISRSKRAAQLATVHPLLACLIYRHGYFSDEEKQRRADARAMVLAGRRLRDIEVLMGAPKRMRRIQPGATSFTSHAWPEDAIAHMPSGTVAQRAWLGL